MVRPSPLTSLPSAAAGGPLDHLPLRMQEWAAQTFQDGGFPHREINALREAGGLFAALPGIAPHPRPRPTSALLRQLQLIGKGNLAVGRIYEGHVNALHLIGLYATEAQRQRWYAEAQAGHLFGVWNTQMQDGVHLHTGPDGKLRLEGSKSFCSGSVHVTRPLITGALHTPDGEDRGWQMAIVPLDRHNPVVDERFWTPVGMRNSVSHKIDFTGIPLAPADLLGAPNDYVREPTFSSGAIRFAAVQLGGAEAVLEATRTFLLQAGRKGDPYQRTRVGQMAILVETGQLWLERAGQLIDRSDDATEIITYANMVRTVIAEACEDCLDLAQRCVGARGLLHPHPIARLHADLTMYLRQPGPDAALEGVGKHYLDDSAD